MISLFSVWQFQTSRVFSLILFVGEDTSTLCLLQLKEILSQQDRQERLLLPRLCIQTLYYLVDLQCQIYLFCSISLHTLYQLLLKDSHWRWSTECQDAFDKAKALVSEAPVLLHYDEKNL